MNLLYKPFGIAFSVLGGMVAGRVFDRVWKTVAKEDDSPDARDRDRALAQIVAAAAVPGALYGTAKALADRAAARSFEKVTGTWPESG